jgi:hypothetical protein
VKSIPTEPTVQQCNRAEYLPECDGYACWYPQMGEARSKCVIVFRDNGTALVHTASQPPIPGGCFTAYVWHDGTLPFDSFHAGAVRSPAQVHHCNSGHFIEFGRQVRAFEIARQRGKSDTS